MAQIYGFASRQEGNCTASTECGETFDNTHKWCCPTKSTCQSNDYDRVCCDSSDSFAVCLNKYIGKPVCATSSFTLYDNAGYFCCDPQSIGMRVIRGNSIHSYCGARTGFTVANATILQPVASSDSDDDDDSSSISNGRGPKQTSAAATAGIALGGIVLFIVLAFVFFWWRRRKGGWPSGVRKDRKGDPPLTVTTPKPSDDWEKDVAMQNMPMAKAHEPSKPAPMPFIREVTHFELPTDAPMRTPEAEAGWTEMSSKRDSRLPRMGPQEVSTVHDSRLGSSSSPPAVPPKDSAVSPIISPVGTERTRTMTDDGVILGRPRTS